MNIRLSQSPFCVLSVRSNVSNALQMAKHSFSICEYRCSVALRLFDAYATGWRCSSLLGRRRAPPRPSSLAKG